MCDVTVLIMTGLPNYFGPPVVTPPDAVAYYEAEDGSVLAEVHRHWEGDGGRHGATVFLDQAWPDGSSHLERGSAFVTSLDQLRRLPHAEQSMIEHMDEA
jgi:hypothetical protein